MERFLDAETTLEYSVINFLSGLSINFNLTKDILIFKNGFLKGFTLLLNTFFLFLLKLFTFSNHFIILFLVELFVTC